MERGLNGGCRSWSGNREGRRALEGRMDRGGDDKRGMVGRTRGVEEDGMDWVAAGWRGRYREGGRGTQLVMARGGQMRRGLEGGRNVERRWDGDGGGDGKRGRDGDGGGGEKELFPSRGGAGF